MARCYNEPMKITRESQTAYHEAGHAVIGRVLTLPCGHASIKPDYESCTAGVSICPDPYTCLSEWEKRGKVRAQSAVWIARIIHSMAGAEAAAELLGAKQHGDEDDRYQVRIWIGLNLLAYLKAVQLRHHYIKKH